MAHHEQVKTNDELLTPKQVADELRLDIRTIYRYIRNGQLPVVRLSAREFRIWRSKLNEFLRERETDKAID
jgi:excisionase family DNA binding protein